MKKYCTDDDRSTFLPNNSEIKDNLEIIVENQKEDSINPNDEYLSEKLGAGTNDDYKTNE